MNQIKLIIFVLCSLGSTFVFSQKAQFKKADKAYKAQNYSEAIPLYEEGLAIKENLSRKTKLANSYRMINQLDKAATLFREVVRDPKAKPITYLYLGESLMGSGNYDEAKYWFQQYHTKEPEDQKALLLIAACNQVKDIKSVFPDMGVIPFAQNSEVDDNAPIFWQNQILFSSDRNQGIKLLKQKSGVTGRDYIQIYSASEGSNFTYADPKPYSGKVNELNKNSSNISISADGTRAVFSRNSKDANKKNTHTIQLFEMTSTDGKKWKNVKPVDFSNNAYNFMHPALSPDGNTLFFVSDKGSGEGGTDIYVSYYKKEKWSRPVNLGPVINTTANEGFPFFDQDGKLFFCSKGHAGFGGFDIFFSTQNPETEQWDVPINVGTPVNSPADDISIFIDQKSRRALFTSSREGGDDDIYLGWLDGLPDELKETETVIPDPQPEIAETITEPATITESPTVDPIIAAPVEVETETETLTEVDTPAEAISPAPAPATIKTSAEILPAPTAETVMPDEVTPPEIDTPETRLNVPVTEKIKTVSEAIQAADIELPKVQTAQPVKISSSETMTEKATDAVPAVEITSETPAEISVPAADPVKEPANVAEPMIEKEISKVETPAVEKPVVENPATTIPTPIPATEELPSPPATENKPDGENLSATMTPRSSFSTLKKDLKKKRSTAGKIYRLKNISYDPGGYLVARAHGDALNEVYKLLQKNPKLTIQLASHTYSVGNDQNNLKLSQNRANRAAEYLIEKGISAERIFPVGYGETQILNRCANGVACTQAEHAKNERLEIQIMDEAH